MTKHYDKPLTAEQLAARGDDEIDTTDIPELGADFWDRAEVSPPRTKPVVSLRLPQEVVDYFKATNEKGYTGRMAAVLAAYVNAQQDKR